MNRWVVSALAALLLAGCAKEMSVEQARENVSTMTADGTKLTQAEIENPELVENPGMRIALERLDGYAAASIARYEAWADSMEVVMLNRLVAESPESVVTIEEYLASSEYSGGTRVEPLDSSYTTIEITKGPWTTTSR